MILDFVKDENGRWFANAEVNADFGIHIEKNNDGALYVSYSSVAGAKPARVEDLCMKDYECVMDQNVVGVVYPAYLTIEARTKEAPYAVVSSEGDVVDITNVLNTPV